jgi:putative tryptophan/tyrosine transport system substrate-binding protein
MRRREFIALIGASVTWPFAAMAQQAGNVRRVGMLMGSSESDSRAYVDAFVEELARLGWKDGRNVQFEQRWTNADSERASAFATELIGSQPDVIFATTTLATSALHRETSTIPIVFAIVSDPVGAGFVSGLPRPGGNITGFTNLETAHCGRPSNPVAPAPLRMRQHNRENRSPTTPSASRRGAPFRITARMRYRPPAQVR